MMYDAGMAMGGGLDVLEPPNVIAFKMGLTSTQQLELAQSGCFGSQPREEFLRVGGSDVNQKLAHSGLSPQELEQIVARVNQAALVAGLRTSQALRRRFTYRFVRGYLPVIFLLGFVGCMVGGMLSVFIGNPFSNRLAIPGPFIGNIVCMLGLIASSCAGQSMMVRTMMPQGRAPLAVSAEVAAITASQLAARGVKLELEHVLQPVSAVEAMGGGCTSRSSGAPEMAGLTWMLFVILPPVPGQEAVCVTTMSGAVADMRMPMGMGLSYGYGGQGSMMAMQQAQMMAMQQQQQQAQMMQGQAMQRQALQVQMMQQQAMQAQAMGAPYGGAPAHGAYGGPPPGSSYQSPYGQQQPQQQGSYGGSAAMGPFVPAKQQQQTYGLGAQAYAQPTQAQQPQPQQQQVQQPWPPRPAVGAYNPVAPLTYQPFGGSGAGSYPTYGGGGAGDDPTKGAS